jgi:hypothetical protein
VEDGIVNWSYEELKHLHDLLRKMTVVDVGSRKSLSPRQRAALEKAPEETQEEKDIREMLELVEVCENFSNASSMYEAANAVEALLKKLRTHSAQIVQTIAEYATGSVEKMRQEVCEYPTPFVADFFYAAVDSEFSGSGRPGAPIQSTSEGGRAEAAGVLPGWRLVTIQRGTTENPIGDPLLCTDINRAQQILDRWGSQAQPLRVTFEGPEIVVDTDGDLGDMLDDRGKQAMLHVLRVGMDLGALPAVALIKDALHLGGHWRHGVERFEDLVQLSEEINGYYQLGATEGPPERQQHLCWGLSGVPEELEDINAVAQTYRFIGGNVEPEGKLDAEEDAVAPEKPNPMRPRVLRPYDRLRRPLSPTRVERPTSDAYVDLQFSKYALYSKQDEEDDGILEDDGVTPLSSRPISAATSRPVSAMSRPKSAATSRPVSAVSRPKSARPASAVTVQKPRPMSATATNGTSLHVRLPSHDRPASAPTASATRPASAPGRRNSWLYRRPSVVSDAPSIGFGGMFVPPRRPPPGPWSRKCRENGAEVLRHKLASCLLLSRASPF